MPLTAMSFTAPQLAVALIGLLHTAFALGELFPWESPAILQAVIKKWPQKPDLKRNESHLVAMIVHNAGIYNGILAAALFVSVLATPQDVAIQLSLLIGGIVAGIFGAFTLTKATIIQAILGAMAVAVVLTFSA